MIKCKNILKEYGQILNTNTTKIVNCLTIPQVDIELKSIQWVVKMLKPKSKVYEKFCYERFVLKIFVDDSVKFVIRVL
jgi:hypothetical protein